MIDIIKIGYKEKKFDFENNCKRKKFLLWKKKLNWINI